MTAETPIKNPHAQALGRLGKGVPRHFSRLARQRARERMITINQRREAVREAARASWLKAQAEEPHHA